VQRLARPDGALPAGGALQAHGIPHVRQTVFTIHNLKYQGIHGVENIADLMDMPPEYLTEDRVLKDGVPANFMKAGIVYADAVTTVSPTYADEILTTRYGEGLDGVLRQYSHKIRGF
jgi:starch synthase